MQGSTVVISPPDGDMAAYLASLRRIRMLDPPMDAIAPGHGTLVRDPLAAVDAYLDHRRRREAKVAAAVRAAGSVTVDDLVPSVYDDVGEDRYPVARRSLWAHLRKLDTDGCIVAVDPDDDHTTWRWAR